jgi:hypothetical protein
VGHRVRRLVHQGEIDEPLGVAAVEVQLVDRLGRAAIPQLGRPVRGEHDQRYPAERRLDDRRREVDGSGAGGPEQHDRLPRGSCDAQSEERGRAFIDQHPDGDPVMGPQRQRHRS